MKVKFLEARTYWDLERLVNDALSKLSDSDIIDLKYPGNVNHAPYGLNCYSVMIVYSEKK